MKRVNGFFIVSALLLTGCTRVQKVYVQQSPSPGESASPSASPAAAGASVAPATPAPTSIPLTARPSQTNAPVRTTQPTPKPAPKTVTADKGANGQTIALVNGDTLEIVLDENPSTGYQWKFTTSPDDKVLKVTADRYEANSGGGQVGGGGKHRWTLAAVGRNRQTQLQLDYYPPGEGSTPDPSDTYKLIVQVWD